MSVPDPSPTDVPPELLAGEPPFAAHIGVVIVSASEDRVVAELVVGDALRNRNGVMHGGAVMAFADCIAGTASQFYLAPGVASVTVEAKTNFIRAIRIGERIRAECRVRHLGRTTAVLETNIFAQDGRLAAIVVQTQLTMSR